MAMNPRDVPYTREEVYEWLLEYNGRIRDTKKLREYLEQKLSEKEGFDPAAMVNTTGHDNLPNETSVVDMIIMDLDSYGFDKRD
ncbi:MAG: hypothetical protein EHM23_25395 [Acidobacteria bacterium]|jgi:hypothetical protein|nr:MAG: hypothetical protein EHM23_25395 [Acidobacteriota bacterium]